MLSPINVLEKFMVSLFCSYEMRTVQETFFCNYDCAFISIILVGQIVSVEGLKLSNVNDQLHFE